MVVHRGIPCVLARDCEGVLLFAGDAEARQWTLHVEQAHHFARRVAAERLLTARDLSFVAVVVPLHFARRHLAQGPADCHTARERLPMLLRRHVGPCSHPARHAAELTIPVAHPG